MKRRRRRSERGAERKGKRALAQWDGEDGAKRMEYRGVGGGFEGVDSSLVGASAAAVARASPPRRADGAAARPPAWQPPPRGRSDGMGVQGCRRVDWGVCAGGLLWVGVQARGDPAAITEARRAAPRPDPSRHALWEVTAADSLAPGPVTAVVPCPAGGGGRCRFCPTCRPFPERGPAPGLRVAPHHGPRQQ